MNWLWSLFANKQVRQHSTATTKTFCESTLSSSFEFNSIFFRERAFLFYLVRFQFKVRVISIIGIRRCFFLLQLKLKSQSRTKHIAIWSVTLSVMKVHHGIETFRVLDSVHTCTLCAEHFMHFLQCHKSTLGRNV